MGFCHGGGFSQLWDIATGERLFNKATCPL